MVANDRSALAHYGTVLAAASAAAPSPRVGLCALFRTPLTSNTKLQVRCRLTPLLQVALPAAWVCRRAPAGGLRPHLSRPTHPTRSSRSSCGRRSLRCATGTRPSTSWWPRPTASRLTRRRRPWPCRTRWSGSCRAPARAPAEPWRTRSAGPRVWCSSPTPCLSWTTHGAWLSRCMYHLGCRPAYVGWSWEDLRWC